MLLLLSSSSFLLPLLFFLLLGLCIGSFLNVLIDRLPNGKSIGGRSHCDHCKHALGIGDLIPVFSYIFLQGKCRYCKKKIAKQNIIIELLTGVAFMLTWVFFPDLYSSPIQLLGYFLLTSSSIVIVGADFKYHIIPDSATVFFILASFLVETGYSIATPLFGGVGLFLILYLIYALTRGKMMGFGDVKLAFGIGVLFGLYNGLLALYLSFVTGGIVSMCLLLSGKSKLKSKIAFGPFLITGTFIMPYFGDNINQLIQKIF